MTTTPKKMQVKRSTAVSDTYLLSDTSAAQLAFGTNSAPHGRTPPFFVPRQLCQASHEQHTLW